MSKAKDFIEYYEKKIDRCKDDEVIILDSIRKLSNLAVAAGAIQDTGIYNIMKNLSFKNGKVGQKASELFNKWQLLVPLARKDRESSANLHPHKEQALPPINRGKTDIPPNKDPKCFIDSKSQYHHKPLSASTFDKESVSKLKSLDQSWHHHRTSEENHHSFDHPKSSSGSSKNFKAHDGNHKESLASSGHPTSTSKYKDMHSTKNFHPKLHTAYDNREVSSTSGNQTALFKERNHHGKHDSSKVKCLQGEHHHHHDSFKEKCNHGNHHDTFKEISYHGNQLGESFKKSHQVNHHQDSTQDKSHHSNHPTDSLFKEKSNLGYHQHQDSFKDKSHQENKNNDSVREKSRHVTDLPKEITYGSSFVNHNGDTNSSNAYADIDSEFNPHLSIEDSDKLISQLFNMESPAEKSAEPPCPSKSKVLEPYSIEMKEGMFRVVKVKPKKNFKPDALEARLNYHKDMIMNSIPYEMDKDSTKEKTNSLKMNLSTSETQSGDKSRHKDISEENMSVHSTRDNLNSPTEGFMKKKNPSSPNVSMKDTKNNCKRSSSSPMMDKLNTPEKKRLTLSPNGSSTENKLKFQKSLKESPSHIKPAIEFHLSNCDRKASKNTDVARDSAKFICSKKERSAVYSGKKNVQDILSLRDNCVRVLRKNIDNLKSSRDVSYDVLKPVLEHCTPIQLHKVEEHNKHFCKFTNELWKQLCNKDHRSCVPNKHETWKTAYWRSHKEQKRKLESLTASISASKKGPERQLKMTIVDSSRDPHRKRMKSDSPNKTPKLASPTTICAKSESPKRSKQIHPESVKPQGHMPKLPKKADAPLMTKAKKSMQFFARSK